MSSHKSISEVIHLISDARPEGSGNDTTGKLFYLTFMFDIQLMSPSAATSTKTKTGGGHDTPPVKQRTKLPSRGPGTKRGLVSLPDRYQPTAKYKQSTDKSLLYRTRTLKPLSRLQKRRRVAIA
jgi:hypothetical protein